MPFNVLPKKVASSCFICYKADFLKFPCGLYFFKVNNKNNISQLWSALFLHYFSIPQKCLWRPLKRTLRHANEFRKRLKLFFPCPIDDASKILWKPINPFHATGLSLYPRPLWTWKIIWFSDLFRWFRKKLVTWNCLRAHNIEVSYNEVLQTQPQKNVLVLFRSPL